ncbi:hypothetical protein ACFX15_018840 [Malus domestica]
MLLQGSLRGGAVRRLAGARSWLGMGRGDVVAGTTAWAAWLGLSQGLLVRLGSRIVALGCSARRAAWLMSFGLLDLTRTRLAIEKNEEIVGLMGYWNVRLNSPTGYHEWCWLL